MVQMNKLPATIPARPPHLRTLFSFSMELSPSIDIIKTPLGLIKTKLTPHEKLTLHKKRPLFFIKTSRLSGFSGLAIAMEGHRFNV
jgi:hypothetical protein